MKAFLLMMVMAFCSITSQAQTATISGKVTDPGGSPVAGATVEYYSGSSNLATAVTDVNGNYSFSVNPATFRGDFESRGWIRKLIARAAGFITTILDNVTINIGHNGINITLSWDLEYVAAPPIGEGGLTSKYVDIAVWGKY
ncbi:carboxypeptidase family protein [Chitinophaga skermanii]|uniref:Carboxypeptidase family protein n=1 Tax=Chitinophaga skermanii TaxID=331697 RepID=A0A327QIZ3_9BACT|nr:carboxypeptidase-like regulatory domain-containing protein [Chitinophaga skermanii]RAJ04231.1 carboxypeptidase family protein [Chitinophaga skermanii]